MSEYESAIAALFARTGTTAKLGLERTRALLAQLNDPHRWYPTLHVAGTNGKGSVVAMLYALLRARGLSVGRYTSPHLIDFRERIVVDDEQIGEEEVLTFLRRWEGESDRLGATFFELTTVLAFEHFARRRVDVAVIETGMGGRLDATNVITPVVAGVTSVSMDHAEYLGDSLAAIAREKAGIFKWGVPAVVGALDPVAAYAIVGCARDVGAELTWAAEAFPVHSASVSALGTDVKFGGDHAGESVRVGLVGRVQAANCSVALAMLQAAGEPYAVSMDDARRLLPTVQLAGRFQRIGKYVLDVAHNPEGIRALCEIVRAVDLPRPLVAVVAILRDKPWLEMLRELASVVDGVVLSCPVSAPGERIWDIDAVAADVGRSVGDVRAMPDLTSALRLAEGKGGTVLVTGSFYTVGDALQTIAISSPSDRK